MEDDFCSDMAVDVITVIPRTPPPPPMSPASVNFQNPVFNSSPQQSFIEKTGTDMDEEQLLETSPTHESKEGTGLALNQKIEENSTEQVSPSGRSSGASGSSACNSDGGRRRNGRSSRRRHELTIAEKVQVLLSLDAGGKFRELAERFNISIGSVSNIKKNREHLLHLFRESSAAAKAIAHAAAVSAATTVAPNSDVTTSASPEETADEATVAEDNASTGGSDVSGFTSGPSSAKRRRFDCLREIDEQVHQYYCRCRSQNERVTGPRLQQVAEIVAAQNQVDGFKASVSWLQAFKRRYGVKIRDEAKSPSNIVFPLANQTSSAVNSIPAKADSDLTPPSSDRVRTWTFKSYSFDGQKPVKSIHATPLINPSGITNASFKSGPSLVPSSSTVDSDYVDEDTHRGLQVQDNTIDPNNNQTDVKLSPSVAADSQQRRPLTPSTSALSTTTVSGSSNLQLSTDILGYVEAHDHLQRFKRFAELKEPTLLNDVLKLQERFNESIVAVLNRFVHQ